MNAILMPGDPDREQLLRANLGKIVKTYKTATAERAPYPRRRLHIVECQIIPRVYLGKVLGNPVAARKALCGVTIARHMTGDTPIEQASCPTCRSQFKIVTCPACASGTGQHACGLSGLQAQLRIGGR